MGELWRRASELFWKHPLLWLPALLADLLGFATGQAQFSLLRHIVLSHMQYHSVLGGAVQKVPLNAAGMEASTVQGLVVNWCSYFIRILLYVAAFVLTADLVRRFAGRVNFGSSEVGTELRSKVGGILSVALRVLAIYAAGAVVFGLTSSQLAAHGQRAVLASIWYRIVFMGAVTICLAVALAAPALRLLTGQPRPAVRSIRQTRVVAVAMGLASMALMVFVGTNERVLLTSAPLQRTVLGALGSLLATVPYVVMFIAIGLIALQRTGGDETETK